MGRVDAVSIAGLELWFNSSDHLPPHFHDRKTQRPSTRPPNTPDHLREVLERAGWNRTQAARDLGISRVTLWKRMKSAGIEAPKRGQKSG